MSSSELKEVLHQPDYSALDQIVEAIDTAFSAGVSALKASNDPEVKRRQIELQNLMEQLNTELDKLTIKDKSKLVRLAMNPIHLVAAASRAALNFLESEADP